MKTKTFKKDDSNSILISFIIPCWNSQKTISRCLQSIIINQSINIEIICVDDCSNDNTAAIINSLIKQDERIQYFKKYQHTNAGDTRNLGITNASGLYCWFVDSDDIIAPDSVDKLIKNMKQYSHPDLIIFSYKMITEQGHAEKKQHIQTVSNTILEIKNINIDIYYQRTSPVVWNKLFKLKLINDNRLKFQSIKSSNDIFFTRAYMSIVRNFLFLDEYIYFNDRTIRDSISALRGNAFFPTHLANLKLRKFLIVNNIYMKFRKTFLKSYQSNAKHEYKNTDNIIYKFFHITIIFLLGCIR
tara:strand:- start:1601 stop:2503 length:903 start_codon:yes stop_codon:yes gene_type:complete